MRILTLSSGFHVIGYPRVTDLAHFFLIAKKYRLKLTLCPSVWRRMSKFWKENTFFDYAWKPRLIKKDLIILIHQARDIVDIQRLLFARHGWKLRIKTLKKWIVQERRGRVLVR